MVRKKATFSPGIFLLPVFLIIIAGIGWRIFAEWQKSKLGETQRYNVVFSSEGDRLIKLVSLDRLDKTITILDFPEDLFVKVAYGYGKYFLSKAWEVGELDRRGGKVLAATVGDLVGVPVDGYIRIKTRGISRTNLSVFDLGRLGWEGIKVRKDKIKTIDVGKLGVTDELLLADGGKARAPDVLRLDYFLQGEFLERDLREENLKVEVLNAGGELGLGTAAARVLETAGIDVVNVGNSDLELKKCEVRVTNKYESSKTVKRMVGIFGCRVLSKEEGRADVTLLLRVLHPDE